MGPFKIQKIWFLSIIPFLSQSFNMDIYISFLFLCNKKKSNNENVCDLEDFIIS